MVWIARIIFGIFLLIFIKKRPNLSILLGIGLLIIYLNDDTVSKTDVKDNIQIEQNTSQIQQKNHLNSLKLNSSREIQSYKRFSEERVERINYEQSGTIKEINKVRVGAVCNDGTTSRATGRGACSHHGGVSYWLYE